MMEISRGKKAERVITFLAKWFCVVVYIGLTNEQFGYPIMSFLVLIKMLHLSMHHEIYSPARITKSFWQNTLFVQPTLHLKLNARFVIYPGTQ